MPSPPLQKKKSQSPQQTQKKRQRRLPRKGVEGEKPDSHQVWKMKGNGLIPFAASPSGHKRGRADLPRGNYLPVLVVKNGGKRRAVRAPS